MFMNGITQYFFSRLIDSIFFFQNLFSRLIEQFKSIPFETPFQRTQEGDSNAMWKTSKSYE